VKWVEVDQSGWETKTVEVYVGECGKSGWRWKTKTANKNRVACMWRW